jgi:DNA-binding transcriptional MocR family regulator
LHFGPARADQRHLVLGYAALTPREIKAGISRLASVLRAATPAGSRPLRPEQIGGRS